MPHSAAPDDTLRAALHGVRALLLDLDGVLVLKGEAVPGSVAALAELDRRAFPYLMLTNTSLVSREKLAQLAIPIQLEEKVIASATDEIAFKHAWRNGKWHAYEPLSLDLADAEGIKDKARRWRGHLAAVADGAREELKLNFIVGAPRDPALRPAYQNALTILRQAEFSPAVFEDTQIDTLVAEIEDEVRAHERRRG